jgi:hypothetical protein
MHDYRVLRVDIGQNKRRYVNWFRDHGHEANITRAYVESKNNADYYPERNRRYVWNTGMLFLKTKEALEQGRDVIIESCCEEENSRPLLNDSDRFAVL